MSDIMADHFSQPTIVIITGAGRGVGRSLCLELVRELKPSSVLLLFGRSEDSLQATRSRVLEINSTVTAVVYCKFDCNLLDTCALACFLEAFISSSTKAKLTQNNSALLLIHNAGTVGNPSQQCVDYDLETTSEYMMVNFTSMVSANTIILQAFKAWGHKTVVNVSSLCAVQAQKSLGLYCSGKAARDMFFKVLAAENPSLRVLNYAPGPIDTDMFRLVKDTSCDQETKTLFQGLTPVKLEDTTHKLITILKEDKFESGAHVDYFDEKPV